MLGFSFVKILAPAYFAREDTKTPVKFGLIALAVNFSLSVVLAYVLTRAGYPGTHAGLALAISVAALLNAWLLFRGLRRDGVIGLSSGWSALLLRFAVGNLALVFCLQWLHRPLDWWLGAALVERAGWLALVIAAGAAAYFAVLLIVGVRFSQLRLESTR